MQAVTFTPGVPQLIILESSDGLEIGNGSLYRLTDARYLYLERQAAESLNALKPQPGEGFWICQRRNGTSWYWDMWLSPRAEQLRAGEEIRAETGEDLTPLLVKSIEQVRSRRRSAPDPPAPAAEILRKPPASELKPTGTEAAAIPAKLVTKTITPRIPFNVAFAEVLDFVTHELKVAGEQWTDQARQDLISTILITAGKQGYLTVWERQEQAA